MPSPLFVGIDIGSQVNSVCCLKNDRANAWFIAAKLRTGLLQHPFTWSEPLMALQRLTRARYLKYYLVEAANSVRVHDPVFAEYYAKKKAEPKEFAEGRALAPTARKLLRLVFYLLKTHRLYTSEGGIRQHA